MEVRGHLPLAELERLEREERDARRARRLRIVILALKGYTAPAIAMSLGLSRRVCQAWVFQDRLPAELRRIAAAHPGKRLLVFFQDESRFGQQGTTTNVWGRWVATRR